MEIEHVALRLKNAVWEEYKVEENLEEECGLFWVLNPTRPPMSTGSKAEPIVLNLFSVSFCTKSFRVIEYV